MNSPSKKEEEEKEGKSKQTSTCLWSYAVVADVFCVFDFLQNKPKIRRIKNKNMLLFMSNMEKKNKTNIKYRK